MRPEHGDLVCTRITESTSLPYARADVATALGRVRNPAAVPWITYGPDLAHIPDARWVLAVAPERSIVLRTSSFTAQVAAVEAGLGATLLPDDLGDARPSVRRVEVARSLAKRLPPFPVGQLWLVAHRAMRSVPRIAAVWQHVVDETAALREP